VTVLNRASPGSTGSGTDFFHLWRPVTLVATTASDLFGGSKWSPTPTSARQVKLQFSGSGHLLSEIILRQVPRSVEEIGFGVSWILCDRSTSGPADEQSSQRGFFVGVRAVRAACGHEDRTVQPRRPHQH